MLNLKFHMKKPSNLCSSVLEKKACVQSLLSLNNILAIKHYYEFVQTSPVNGNYVYWKISFHNQVLQMLPSLHEALMSAHLGKIYTWKKINNLFTHPVTMR